jgi:hypothetical protein
MAEHLPRILYHMLPGDIAIWRRFLLQYEEQFDRFTYDVHCGPKLRVEDPNMPWLADFSERALSLRIDVVAEKPGEVWIIEVKPNAGLGALGQLIAYRYYLDPSWYAGKELKAVLVTDYARHYMIELDAAFELVRIIV